MNWQHAATRLHAARERSDDREHAGKQFLKSQARKFRDLLGPKITQIMYKTRNHLIPSSTKNIFMDGDGLRLVIWNVAWAHEFMGHFSRTRWGRTWKGMNAAPLKSVSKRMIFMG